MLPSESALQTISHYLTRLQAADSPLEKLEYLLAAIATIFNSVSNPCLLHLKLTLHILLSQFYLNTST